jgi:hypothetical protein
MKKQMLLDYARAKLAQIENTEFFCEVCRRYLTRREVREVERDETCLSACRQCEETVRYTDELETPF